jgi:hypothetical protein
MKIREWAVFLLVFIGSVCAGILGGFGDGMYFAVIFSLFAVFGALMILATTGDDERKSRRAGRNRIKDEYRNGRARPA